MKSTTELVFLLDRSGSMSGLESDTIGGFNAMIEKQRNKEGTCEVTSVLFNHRQMTLHDRKDIHAIKPLSDYDYTVRGSTALLDALGETINKITSLHGWMNDDQKPNKVLFVITTDGLENSSREYTYEQIKSMIEEKRRKNDWEFIFLGANIDAVGEATRLGIDKTKAAAYHPDKKGTRMNYQSLNHAIDDFRANRNIRKEWASTIKSYAEKKEDDET